MLASATGGAVLVVGATTGVLSDVVDTVDTVGVVDAVELSELLVGITMIVVPLLVVVQTGDVGADVVVFVTGAEDVVLVGRRVDDVGSTCVVVGAVVLGDDDVELVEELLLGDDDVELVEELLLGEDDVELVEELLLGEDDVELVEELLLGEDDVELVEELLLGEDDVELVEELLLGDDDVELLLGDDDVLLVEEVVHGVEEELLLDGELLDELLLLDGELLDELLLLGDELLVHAPFTLARRPVMFPGIPADQYSGIETAPATDNERTTGLSRPTAAAAGADARTAAPITPATNRSRDLRPAA